MGWDAPWHWVVLAIVVIALFGYKKLPDAARSLGRSLRIFKTEIKGMTEDDKARAKAREDGEPAEPKALPAAEIVKNDVPKARPRPTPSPNGHAGTTAKAE
ncbi:MAG: sec-independent protein translocase protein TatA [Pseudonocardiales bacterium]|jgi:sec-independent protein translocase protein TatA|nr:sec-independent protein translocase protein TatA [Pseudonocardiales bacterium]